jgi:hypothetical protein
MTQTSSQPLHSEHPLQKYYNFLDIRDRIWAETKIIEASKRDGSDPALTVSLLFVAQYQIQQLSKGLKKLETAWPEYAPSFECLCDIRFSTYAESHLVTAIQPYLSTYRPSIPDYGFFDSNVDLLDIAEEV